MQLSQGQRRGRRNQCEIRSFLDFECIDLALALVAEDLGRSLTLEVARDQVVYLKRPVGQSHYNVPSDP
ncbi:MAG: hypothetical protein EOO38_26765 [Cytophagaceae bacterium]|nr:MAG: hypothetical protein EOO38_26765 [Cytophagaceae bacterium]